MAAPQRLTERTVPFPFVVGIDLGTTNSVLTIARPRSADLPMRAGEARSSAVATFVPVELVRLPQHMLDGTDVEQALFPSVVYQQAGDTPRYVGAGAAEAKYRARRGREVFYSVKLDMGMDAEYAYPSAVSAELLNPVKVSGVILKAMREAAEQVLGTSLAGVPTIITVPASFQPPQRRDTLRAAELAGWTVGSSNLLDEPNAALLGYINQQRVQQRWEPEETVLVFDFGGGTCDISIIEVSLTRSNHTLTLNALGISRFEMLGGDDIDRHIAHEYLAPLFYEVSGHAERQWSIGERKNRIWSQLYKIAEQLKVRVCTELDKAMQAGWDETKLSTLEVALPRQVIVTSRGEVMLDAIRMDWKRFSDLMRPFVDEKGTGSKDEEYYKLTSIFAPILDTLAKTGLKRTEITRVLLVGGSSYNPVVERALQTFFKDATVDRPERMEYLVAEGAAVQAFYRYYLGHELLEPIVGDTIGLLTEGKEFVPLVHAGTRVPFPSATDWMVYSQFRVPREGLRHVDLVICAGSAQRPVHTVQLQFDRPVPQGATVELRLRMDANKVFHLAALLPEFPGIHVHESIDNPLSLLPMTAEARRRLELEKSLKQAQLQRTLDQHTDDMLALADVLQDLDRAEQSIEWIDLADQRKGFVTEQSKQLRADAHLKLGELDQAHALYAELATAHPREWVYAYMASIASKDLSVRERYMRMAEAISPGNGYVQYALSHVLGDKGDKQGQAASLAKARTLLEAEVQAFPTSAWRLEFLANIYTELGEFALAAVQRQRAQQARAAGTAVDDRHLVSVHLLPVS